MTGYQMLPPRLRMNLVPLIIVSSIAVVLIMVGYAVFGPGSGAAGLAGFAFPIGLALLPIALVIAFRWPMIFPFGLWAALAPFDFLLGAAAGGAITRLLVTFSAGMLVLKILTTRRMLVAPKAWLPWLLLVSWMTLTTLWSIGPDKTGVALSAIIPLFVMLTVVAVYPISVSEMRGVLCAIVLGSLAAAAYGFNLYAHNQVGDDSRLTLMSDSGLVVDANFFATSFLLPIAICLSVAFAHRSGWARLLAVGAIFAMLASIFLSGSRGAFISVTLVMLYFVFKTGNRLALLAIAAGIGSSFVLFPTLLRRWTQAQTNANGSGRTFIWDVGARALADQYHWLTGAGLGTFPLAYNKALSSVYQSTFEGWSRPAHNVLIGNAVELGIFGAALLVFAWWRTFRQAANIAPNSGNYPLRLAAEASVLGLFVNALFIDPLLIKYYWLAFMIPFMLHNVEAPHLMRQLRPISGRFSAFRLRREALAVRRPRSG